MLSKFTLSSAEGKHPDMVNEIFRQAQDDIQSEIRTPNFEIRAAGKAEIPVPISEIPKSGFP